MRHRLLAFCAIQALMAWTAAAQDAQSVLQAAATAMGATQLEIHPVFRDRVERRGGPELQAGAGLATISNDQLHPNH